MPLVSEWLRTLYIWGFCHTATPPPPSHVFIWMGGGRQKERMGGHEARYTHPSPHRAPNVARGGHTSGTFGTKDMIHVWKHVPYFRETIINIHIFWFPFLEISQCNFTKMCILPVITLNLPNNTSFYHVLSHICKRSKLTSSWHHPVVLFSCNNPLIYI